MSNLFAQQFDVLYRWPDDPAHVWHSGTIIYTNIEDHWDEEAQESIAARLCGTYDENVLLYTDDMSHEVIKKNFDGLRFETEWVRMKRYYPEGMTHKEIFEKLISLRYKNVGGMTNDKRR